MKKYLLIILIGCFTVVVKGQVHDDTPIPNISISEPKPRMQGEGGIWVVWRETGYPGGFDSLSKYLNEKIIYPKKALRDKIGGNVLVTFIIEKDGTLTDIEALRSPSVELSDECIRVFKNVVFEPGTQNGKPARVQYAMPVFFDPDNPTQHKKASN